MQRLFTIFVLLAFVGCVTPSATPTDTTNTTAPMPAMMPLPDPIDASEQVTAAADPSNLAQQPNCTAPSSKCFHYPFTLGTNATLTAHLSWTLPASDFDFYVTQGGAPVLNGASDVTAGPGTAEHIEGDLLAGDYEILVVPWSVAQDTFLLHAEFS